MSGGHINGVLPESRAPGTPLTNKLPAVYAQSYYITGGGLISYAPSTTDPYRRAADYVDRILKGKDPADLPVQAPTKYELATQSQGG